MKIERLKQTLELSRIKLPVRIEDYDFIVGDDCELVCRTSGGSVAELNLIVEALNSLPELIEAAEKLAKLRAKLVLDMILRS